MNLNDLQAKLLAAARRNPPRDHVPYAFEKRVMSRLTPPASANPWVLWGGPLWRGAISCLAITLLCGLWSFAASRPQPETAGDLAQNLEAAVFAPMDQHIEDVW